MQKNQPIVHKNSKINNRTSSKYVMLSTHRHLLLEPLPDQGSLRRGCTQPVPSFVSDSSVKMLTCQRQLQAAWNWEELSQYMLMWSLLCSAEGSEVQEDGKSRGHSSPPVLGAAAYASPPILGD